MRRKTRQLPFPLGTGVLHNSSGEIQVDNVGTILGNQVTDSENHQWPIRGLADEGGEFFSQKKFVRGSMINVASSQYDRDNKVTVKYNGPIVPLAPPWNNYFPPPMTSGDSELIKVGTDAIAYSKPTNSVANLANALLELARDGIPRFSEKLWKEKLTLAKASEAHLNTQFAWKPLVNDIMSIAHSISHADELIRQYERDAGMVVRRRWQFPERRSENTSFSSTNNSRPYWTPGHFMLLSPDVPGSLWMTRRFSQRRWFSAAFTYYLPDDWKDIGTMKSVAEKANYLLGVSITPETLWNLTPWSWAADWFGSVGSVISNLSDMADQSLVMRYGYLMEHTIVEDTYTRIYNVPPLKEMRPPVTSHSIVFVTETKLRKRANPYGFGLSWDSLTSLQKSIVAALGITRSKVAR